MTSAKIVRRAVRFETPERVPIQFDSLGFSDFAGCGNCFPSQRNMKGWGGVGADHFGCVWEKTEVKNMGQVKGFPLKDWKALENYKWPDPDDPAYYANMPAALEKAEASGKYVTMGIFMLLFERMHSLHGFEETLVDLYLEPDLCAGLADRLVEYNMRVMSNCQAAAGKGRIHGLGFTDDWGTQQNGFVSLDFWRQFFLPRYKKMFDLAHDFGWTVHMHSCGKVNDLIEGFIEAGVNDVNLQQPRALGIEEIGSRYAGRICFNSLCDIQHTLPFKGEKEIREEAALLLGKWGTSKGGFILSDYGDGEAIGVPLEKKRMMVRAFLDFDPWAKRSGAAHPAIIVDAAR